MDRLIITVAKRMKEKGVKPEIEIFDSGMIVTALRIQQEGKQV